MKCIIKFSTIILQTRYASFASENRLKLKVAISFFLGAHALDSCLSSINLCCWKSRMNKLAKSYGFSISTHVERLSHTQAMRILHKTFSFCATAAAVSCKWIIKFLFPILSSLASGNWKWYMEKMGRTQQNGGRRRHSASAHVIVLNFIVSYWKLAIKASVGSILMERCGYKKFIGRLMIRPLKPRNASQWKARPKKWNFL